MAFGIERRLRRVVVFGPGFFAAGLSRSLQRTAGEGDDAAAFIRDREHDALAEEGKKAALDDVAALIFRVFGADDAGGAQGFLIEFFGQVVAQGVEVVW